MFSDLDSILQNKELQIMASDVCDRGSQENLLRRKVNFRKWLRHFALK